MSKSSTTQMSKAEKDALKELFDEAVKNTNLYKPKDVKFPTDAGKVYYDFTCSRCSKETSNTYYDPYFHILIVKRLCYICNHWDEQEQYLIANHQRCTIINGCTYTPGNRTTGSFRGMAGRRFDIEYIEPSIYAGQKITTFDLWAGSTLPKYISDKFPDTAKFLDAERVNVGEITCWNHSNVKQPEYPHPSTLKPNPVMEQSK